MGDPISKVSFGEGVTSIGESAFEDCNYLDEAIFPKSLRSVGDKAFRNCKELLQIEFYDALETIGDYAFMDCRWLVDVTIGSGLKKLGIGAFYDSIVARVTCRASAPPTYGDYALYRYDETTGKSVPLTCAIFVQYASWNKYKRADGWSAHADMISVYDKQ